MTASVSSAARDNRADGCDYYDTRDGIEHNVFWHSEEDHGQRNEA